MLMHIRLVLIVHLSEPLPWRLGSIGKEGAQIVVLLCNILGRGDKISFALPSLISTKLCQPFLDHSVGCIEREPLILIKGIPWNDQMLLLYKDPALALQ
jgi:hypothetical protein